MEFEVRVIAGGIIRASTFLNADDQEELIEGLHEIVESAESGESDWLDGAFDG